MTSTASVRSRRFRSVLLIGGAVAAAAIIAVVVIAVITRDRGYDPSFDATVEHAHFAPLGGPLIMLDASHHNAFAPDAALRPLCDLVQSDGFRLGTSAGAFSAESLRSTEILVIAGARGANDAGDDSAFSEEEVSAIEQWVRAGGSLLIVSDHWPFGAAVAPLAARLGVGMCRGLVEDAARGDPERGASHIIYTRDNGGLGDHAILAGPPGTERATAGDEATQIDRITRVMTFTGQSLQAPAGAAALLQLTPDAVSYPPTEPTVERVSGDVRVSMQYGKPVPVIDGAQAVAFELGKGRVVVIADAGMIRANRDGGGRHVGMNATGYDNKKLVRNIFLWLARGI